MVSKVSNIKDFQIERCVLACLIKDPAFLAEIFQFITSNFFYHKAHQVIYSAIKTFHDEAKTLDQHILISRLQLMGLSMVDNLPTAEYVGGVLWNTVVDLNSKMIYVRELTKYHYCRETYLGFKKGADFIEECVKSPEKQLKEIVDGAEKHLVNAVTLEAVGGNDDQFVDLYGDMEDLINDGTDQTKILGVDSPFPTFNKWFGKFLIGGLYIFSASSKVGKSTFLSYITDYIVDQAKGKAKVLFIDTEMKGREVACRKMGAKSGVNAFYYLQGGFVNDPDKVRKTEETFSYFQERKGLLYHYYLPSADTEKIESVARRFHSKHVKEGEVLILVLDYLKFSAGEDRTAGGGQQLKEYELIGLKTDAMKKLAEAIPNTISITAIQTNRENEIAQADRVKWYATGIFQLARKTPEEIGEEGKRFGTHTLKSVVIRNWGEFGEEAGAFSASDGKNTKWYFNHINLEFSNFKVTEAGTYKDVINELGSAGQLTPKVSASDRNKNTFNKYNK